MAIALVLFFGVGAGLFFFLRGDSSSVEVAVPEAKVLAEPTPEEVSVSVKSETLAEETVSALEIITATADPVIEEGSTFVEETGVSEEILAEEAVIAEAVAEVAESLPIRVASDAADAEADALALEEGLEDVAQAVEDSATAPIPIPIPVPILVAEVKTAEVKTAEVPQEASATQPADRDLAETETVDDPPEDSPVVTTPTQVSEPVEPRSEALPETSDDVPAPAPESDRTNRRQRIIEEFPDYIPSF